MCFCLSVHVSIDLGYIQKIKKVRWGYIQKIKEVMCIYYGSIKQKWYVGVDVKMILMYVVM